MVGAFQARGQTIINGSFQQGGGSFTGWTTIGGVSIANSSVTTPTNGSAQAFIDNVSGTAVAAADLSAFFNNAVLPKDNFTTPRSATNGSAIKQTFVAAAPETLSFDFKSVTAESLNSEWDMSVFYLDGNFIVLPNPDRNGAALNNSFGVTVNSSTYSFGFPYQTISVSLAAGSHTFGFAVYNTGDTAVLTGLFIDNVVAVPEPGVLELISGGLVALAIAGWRRRAAVR